LIAISANDPRLLEDEHHRQPERETPKRVAALFLDELS
jgi:hypothetical protein